MKRLAVAVRRLSQLFGILAAVCLALACIVVCQMVFMRYALGASTIWQTEFVLYSIVAATLLGSPYVLAEGGHVNVDLINHYVGTTARRIVAVVASLVGISFCAVLTYTGWTYFEEAWVGEWVTESVWAPPLWILLLPLPLGISLLTLQYLVELAGVFAGHGEHEHGEPGR